MNSFTNRVFNPADGPGYTRWVTTFPDPTGTMFPGPGAFGATSDYCVESIERLGADGETVDITLTNSNAGAITAGQPVYSSGDNTVDLADDDTAAKARCIGFVNQASIASSAAGDIAVDGHVGISSADQEGVWLFGQTIYLHSTAGHLTNVVPSVTGKFSTTVGTCANTPAGGNAKLLINIEEPLLLSGLTV